MIRLFLDTETSGLFRPDLSPLDPTQPAMVQLGAVLFDDAWRARGKVVTLIKPEGWEIEPAAERVHGISTRMCHRYGIALPKALVALQDLAVNAERIVGHNIQMFDRQVISLSLYRLRVSSLWWLKIEQKIVDTQELATPVCQLPGEFGQFKFPSLEEAAAILKPEYSFVSKHEAESDIMANAVVYRALVERGAITEAEA